MLPIPVDIAKHLLLNLVAHALLDLVLLPLALVYLAQVCNFERCLSRGYLSTISTAILLNDGTLSSIAANIKSDLHLVPLREGFHLNLLGP
jgi:hypothetical protein